MAQNGSLVAHAPSPQGLGHASNPRSLVCKPLLPMSRVCAPHPPHHGCLGCADSCAGQQMLSSPCSGMRLRCWLQQHPDILRTGLWGLDLQLCKPCRSSIGLLLQLVHLCCELLSMVLGLLKGRQRSPVGHGVSLGARSRALWHAPSNSARHHGICLVACGTSSGPQIRAQAWQRIGTCAGGHGDGCLGALGSAHRPAVQPV